MKCIQAIFLAIILASPARAQWTEPVHIINLDYSSASREAASGDTLYSGSAARIRALNVPALQSSGGLLGSTGSNLITSTVWGPEIRLTYVSDSLNITSDPFTAVHHDTIFVSFSMQLSWGSAPFLLASFDGGENWSDIWCVTNDDTAQLASHPFVNYYGSRLNLCGRAGYTDDFNYYKTYSKYSSDFGITWSEPRWFFERGQHFIGKQAGTSKLDTLIFGFFHQKDNRDRPVDTLKTTCSIDNGETWSDLRGGIHLYKNFDNYWFWLRYSLGRLHLLYQDSSSVENLTEVFYAHSEDWGESWSTPTVVSDDSCQHLQWPYLFASADGKLIASWFDYKYGYGGSGFTGDILYRISTDNGESWGEEMQLTNHHEATASRSYIYGNQIGILWQDSRSGFFIPEFYYAESFDLGQTWGDEIRLTNAPGITDSPDLCLEGDELFLFWEDARHDPPFGEELYFRKAEIVETFVESKVKSVPTVPLLSSYPNPFNSTTVLTLSGSEGGDMTIEILNIMGRSIRTLSTKEGKATWDATDNFGRKVSSGIYFARVETSQNSNTLKLLYLK